MPHGGHHDGRIKVSLVQFEAVPLDPALNGARMLRFARDEAEAGAGLIVFPELSNTGYVEPMAPGEPIVSASGDYGAALFQACAPLDGALVADFCALAAEKGVHIVVGLGLRDPLLAGVMRNASLLIGPEGIAGRYDKIHQWHNEKLYFTEGDRLDVHDLPAARLGMQICYDIRFPEVTRILALQGAEIVTSIWASFGRAGAPVADEQLFLHRAYTRAVENGVFFLSCNRAGTHAGFRFYGRSLVVAPDGRVVAGLATDGEAVLRAELDLAEIAKYRAATGIFADRRPALYARYLKET